MILALIFGIANFYFAYDAFRNKRWGWMTFSLFLGGYCAYQVATAIL